MRTRSIRPWSNILLGSIVLCAARAFATAPATAPATQPAAWSTRLDHALHAAAAEGRDTLVWFSGSGWNAASDAVEPSLRAAAFTGTAAKAFVLARADFAAGHGQPGVAPTDIDPRYTVWAEKFGVAKLPALVAVDATGRPYGTVVTPAGDAAACLRQVENLVKEKIARDAAFAEAKPLTGRDRAAALARGLGHVGPFVRDFYAPVVAELLALDPKDELGLSGKYAPVLSEGTIDKVVQNEIYPLLDKGRFADVIVRIDRLIADAKPTREQRQLLIAFKGQAAYSSGDQTQAVRWLDEALAIDPTGPAAERITKAKQQIVETPAAK